ncbi:MAG TPA: hypothetical protein PKA81_10780 [Clostridia bacterium]|nr:hypothetical protein [Clostridia bacterium]
MSIRGTTSVCRALAGRGLCGCGQSENGLCRYPAFDNGRNPGTSLLKLPNKKLACPFRRRLFACIRGRSRLPCTNRQLSYGFVGAGINPLLTVTSSQS